MNTTDPGGPRLDRRDLLHLSAGAATAATLGLGATGTAPAQEGGDFDGWLSDADNYDGTVVDETGSDEVTITVGSQANGGAFGFAPPAVRVSPGTTVTWEWTGEGGSHNVVTEEGADFSSELVTEAGHTFSQTLEEEGVIKYFCEPHLSLGMKGVVVVGGSGGGGGDGGGGGGQQQATPVPAEYGDWMSDVGNFDGTTVDERGSSEVRITVGAEGNGGGFAFDPPAVRISPGTNVVWEWNGEGGAHNVVGENRDFSSGDPVTEAGTTYERTFEEPGVVTYFCDPHLSLGMKGALVVDPSSPAGGDGGGGGEEEGGTLTLTPELAALLGALALGVISPIVFAMAVAFRDRELSKPEAAGAGGRLERVEPASTEPVYSTESAPETDSIEQELTHDAFDPTGTAALIIAYFLILVVLWVFMYFVEFLGGPTII